MFLQLSEAPEVSDSLGVTALLEGGGGRVCADTIFHSHVDYGWGGGFPRRSLWVLGGSGGSSPRIPGWQPEGIPEAPSLYWQPHG